MIQPFWRYISKSYSLCPSLLIPALCSLIIIFKRVMLTVAAQVLLLPLHHQGHQGGGLHPRARRHAPHTPSQVNIFGKSPNIFLELTSMLARIRLDTPSYALTVSSLETGDTGTWYCRYCVLCTILCTVPYCTVLQGGRPQQAGHRIPRQGHR